MMTAKAYLKQAYRLNAKINSLVMESDELRLLAKAIPSVVLEERVQNGSKKPEALFVKNLEKLIEMENRINQEIDKLADLKLQMSEVIATVTKVDENLVLRLRYIHGNSWENIAEELCVDRSTVLRWHSKALKNLVLPKKLLKI